MTQRNKEKCSASLKDCFAAEKERSGNFKAWNTDLDKKV